MRRTPPANPQRLTTGRLSVALLLAALLLRGLIPAGWMPSPKGLLGAPLVICTASGAQTVGAETPLHPGAPGSQQHHDVCVFAAHFAGPTASPDVDAIPIAFAHAISRPTASVADIAAVARNREQAARAPPTAI